MYGGPEPDALVAAASRPIGPLRWMRTRAASPTRSHEAHHELRARFYGASALAVMR